MKVQRKLCEDYQLFSKHKLEMPTTVRDASLTTARRRQLALFGWRTADQYSSNPQTWKREQPPSNGARGVGPSGIIPLNAFLGANLVGQVNQPSGTTCQCSTPNAITLQGYVKQEPGC
jgi:hypothetical protein